MRKLLITLSIAMICMFCISSPAQISKVNASDELENGVFVINYKKWYYLDTSKKVPTAHEGQSYPSDWDDHPVHVFLEVFNGITQQSEIIPLSSYDYEAHLFMWAEFYGDINSEPIYPIEISSMGKILSAHNNNFFEFGANFAYNLPNASIYTLEGVRFFFYEDGGYTAIFRPGDDPQGFSEIFKIYSYTDWADELSQAYQQGRQDGYNQGYSDGLAAGGGGITTNWFTSFVNSVFDIFDIEIFPGVKLIYLLFIPIGFGIILLILKLVRG